MKVGIIGMGFMGGVHLQNWQKQHGAEVVAICSSRPVSSIAKQGNIASESNELDLSKVTQYTDIATMLENEQLDAVSVCLPTHLHKDVSIQCLKAGVHVLCEKPMALSVEDCDEMIEVAKDTKRELMIAHCIRFWPQYVWASEKVNSGEYGNVLAADFSRLTYAPGWDKDSWFCDQSKSGGIALDLHIHDVDFIQSLFGSPHSIRSQKVSFESGAIGHISSSLDYQKGHAISVTSSWMMPESFGLRMAFNIVFQKAAIEFDGENMTVFPTDGEPFSPDILPGDGYGGQIDYFAKILAGGKKDPRVSMEQSRESVRISLETIK